MLKKFIVERDIKGIGELSSEELGLVAQEFNAAVSIMAGVQWLHSYVVEDKVYDVFLGESAELVVEHSIISGTPVSNVREITATIDPSAESRLQTKTGTLSRETTETSSRETVDRWFARRARVVGR